MAGVFELFHLSLLEKRQRDLFDSPILTREQWLRLVFGERFKFTHRKLNYWWVPADADPRYVTGNVVRSHLRRHHMPPEEGALEVLSEEWQGAMVIIDPSHHDDGQKLSFERDDTVGLPRSVLSSLLADVNTRPDAPYVIEPKPLFRKAAFWDWAAAHEYRLRRIAFEFIVPNMFGSKNAFDEDMKELGEAGVSRVRTKLDEGGKEGGIDANSDAVRNGVDYAAQGGGEVTATAKNGDKFTSTTEAETATLPTPSADRRGGLRALTKWFPSLLGRHEPDDSMDIDVGDAGGPSGG